MDPRAPSSQGQIEQADTWETGVATDTRGTSVDGSHPLDPSFEPNVSFVDIPLSKLSGTRLGARELCG
jgi:hypothetical protein